jgi:hypothetical protein
VAHREVNALVQLSGEVQFAMELHAGQVSAGADSSK